MIIETRPATQIEADHFDGPYAEPKTITSQNCVTFVFEGQEAFFEANVTREFFKERLCLRTFLFTINDKSMLTVTIPKTTT